jgi:hypothetical protein
MLLRLKTLVLISVYFLERMFAAGLLFSALFAPKYEGESESKGDFEMITLVPLMENKCTCYFST